MFWRILESVIQSAAHKFRKIDNIDIFVMVYIYICNVGVMELGHPLLDSFYVVNGKGRDMSQPVGTLI